MRLKAFRQLGDRDMIVANDISVIIAEADDGTPLGTIIQYEPAGGLDGICFANAKDEDFNKILHNLGIHKMVVCRDLGDMSMTVEQAEALPRIWTPGG